MSIFSTFFAADVGPLIVEVSAEELDAAGEEDGRQNSSVHTGADLSDILLS
jgi:hypothetical protein